MRWWHRWSCCQELGGETRGASLPPGAPGSTTSPTAQPSPCSKAPLLRPQLPKHFGVMLRQVLHALLTLDPSRCFSVKSLNALLKGWKLHKGFCPGVSIATELRKKNTQNETFGLKTPYRKKIPPKKRSPAVSARYVGPERWGDCCSSSCRGTRGDGAEGRR